MNQDYAYGRAVEHASREQLVRKRGDIQIVGDDLTKLSKTGDADTKFDVEDTGLGWKTVIKVEANSAIPEIKCQMERPPM